MLTASEILTLAAASHGHHRCGWGQTAVPGQAAQVLPRQIAVDDPEVIPILVKHLSGSEGAASRHFGRPCPKDAGDFRASGVVPKIALDASDEVVAPSFTNDWGAALFSAMFHARLIQGQS